MDQRDPVPADIRRGAAGERRRLRVQELADTVTVGHPHDVRDRVDDPTEVEPAITMDITSATTDFPCRPHATSTMVATQR
jgi:hypothetical protein